MKILGLDVSKHTGFAVLEDGKLVESGTFDVDDPEEFKTLLPEVVTVMQAQELARFVYDKYLKHMPDYIYSEQVNRGKNRHSQKMLDGLHYEIVNMLMTWGWIDKLRYIDTSAWRSVLSVRLNQDQRGHNKQVKQKLIRGKITTKHLAVMKVNEVFGLKLKLKDNNEADAICLCLAGAQDMVFRQQVIKIPEDIFSCYDSLQDRVDQS